MSKKPDEIEFYCPYGHGPFRLKLPSDMKNFENEMIRTHCPDCAAFITVYIGDRRIEGRVEGKSGEEVSKVVR